MMYILVFRPFSEMILNIANALSEAAIFIIFALIASSKTRINSEDLNRIDFMLVFFINFIMFSQMTASILVFGKNIFKYWKKRSQIRVVPINMKYDTQNHPITETNSR